MRRHYLLGCLLLLPFAACEGATPGPSDDAGADAQPADTGVDAHDAAGDSAIDAAKDAPVDSPADAGDAGDASDAADASDASDAADASDASFPTPTGPCGVVHPTAAADGTFYETLDLAPRAVRGDRILSWSGQRGSWTLWSARLGTRVAEGLGAATTTGHTFPQLYGDVLLVPTATGFETRDVATAAVLHAFPMAGTLYKAGLGMDGSYVAVITDQEITFYTPTGVLLRTVLATALPIPDARPFGQALSVVREDGVWLGQGQSLAFVPKANTAPVGAGPFPGQMEVFTADGRHAVWTDTYGPRTTSFRDVTGAQRGVGIPKAGTTGAGTWGKYSWTVTGSTLTLYSIAATNAVALGTYPVLGSSDVPISKSGYLLLQTGILSLRGPTPVLTPVGAYPLAVPDSLEVDETTGTWVLGAGGYIAYGYSLAFAAFGKLGCSPLQSVSGSRTGKLVLAFSDHVELLDSTTGALEARRDLAAGRVLVNELGTVVATDEPATYALPSLNKIGTFTTADGELLALSPDGTRVAFGKGSLATLTSVDERNPNGGALLASRPSTVNRAQRRPEAMYSPDGSKLAVVRSVEEPAFGGDAVPVITDLYATAGAATASCTQYPTYWQDAGTLATETLPSGTRTPPRWNAFAGVCFWTGAGAATQIVAGPLGTRNGPDFLKYQRRANGLLFQETPPTVTELGAATPPWTVPNVTPTLNRDRTTFAGRSFYWLASSTATTPAGVRRHTF